MPADHQRHRQLPARRAAIASTQSLTPQQHRHCQPVI
jgi:hypothetical protein